MSGSLRSSLLRVRYHVRKLSWVGAAAYMVPNVVNALLPGRWGEDVRAGPPRGRVALCLRFRDEAPFLGEWLEYHRAAGVDHFFMYDNFSEDDYAGVLDRFPEPERVTLIGWPFSPASPGAEHDCIARARGRFEWVGFLDADEFVVVRDGRSVPEFLAGFPDAPGVALHWYQYGSAGHERRPPGRVIEAYTRRSREPNRHFKVFVRPERVTRNRNSHNFYYRGAACAVREDGSRAFGSMAARPVAREAWINHYHYKSLEDYLEKAARSSTLDRSGMAEPSRRVELAQSAMTVANEVEDLSAVRYLESRKRARGRVSGSRR